MYGNATICFAIYLPMDICFQFLIITNKAAKNIQVQDFNFSDDIDHLFIYLFAICVSSLVKCLPNIFLLFKLGCIIIEM